MSDKNNVLGISLLTVFRNYDSNHFKENGL